MILPRFLDNIPFLLYKYLNNKFQISAGIMIVEIKKFREERNQEK